MNKDKVIIGIDPGTLVMGYGIIQIDSGKASLISAGAIELKKITDPQLKLKTIFTSVLELLDTFKPDELAIEDPFYGKNVQSMLKLGRAQGVAISAALTRDIPITEYSPKKIKQSITGNGNATKMQVCDMLGRIFETPFEQKYLDASDGVAVALCHFYQNENVLLPKRKSHGWNTFILNNPEKLIP